MDSILPPVTQGIPPETVKEPSKPFILILFISLFSLIGIGSLILVIYLSQENQLSKKTISTLETEMAELRITPTPDANLAQQIPSSLLPNIRKLRVINYPQQEGENAVPLFDIVIPDGWNITTYQPDFLYDLILTKDQYQIRIAEPIEGSMCEFDDSYRFGEGPSAYYPVYESIPTSFDPNLRFGKTVRLADDTNTTEGTILLRSCTRNISPLYKLPIYQNPTAIGVIMLTMPEKYDPKIFNEMKTILKNIQLVKTNNS